MEQNTFNDTFYSYKDPIIKTIYKILKEGLYTSKDEPNNNIALFILVLIRDYPHIARDLFNFTKWELEILLIEQRKIQLCIQNIFYRNKRRLSYPENRRLPADNDAIRLIWSQLYEEYPTHIFVLLSHSFIFHSQIC